MWVRRMKAQGVVFMSTFPPVGDLIGVFKAVAANPSAMPLKAYIDSHFKGKKRPQFTGMTIFGMNSVVISDPSLLEEVFVKKNAYYTKHPMKRDGGRPLVFNNIVAMDTHHPTYAPKRKALSSAFFKDKVQDMITSIKKCTLLVFKEL